MRCDKVPYDGGEHVNVFVAVDQDWNQILLDHLDEKLNCFCRDEGFDRIQFNVFHQLNIVDQREKYKLNSKEI